MLAPCSQFEWMKPFEVSIFFRFKCICTCKSSFLRPVFACLRLLHQLSVSKERKGRSDGEIQHNSP